MQKVTVSELNIFDLIHEAIAIAGSIAALSREIDVSRQAIYCWVEGRKPNNACSLKIKHFIVKSKRRVKNGSNTNIR